MALHTQTVYVYAFYYILCTGKQHWFVIGTSSSLQITYFCIGFMGWFLSLPLLLLYIYVCGCAQMPPNITTIQIIRILLVRAAAIGEAGRETPATNERNFGMEIFSQLHISWHRIWHRIHTFSPSTMPLISTKMSAIYEGFTCATALWNESRTYFYLYFFWSITRWNVSIIIIIVIIIIMKYTVKFLS